MARNTSESRGSEADRLFKGSKITFTQKRHKTNHEDKLYKNSSPKEFISIPSFTMCKGHEYDFNLWNPTLNESLKFITAWGSSECTKKEGNPTPIQSATKSGAHENPEGSIHKALQNNCRFGFVAGGLDDRGIYADFYEGGQEQYPPGLTAIISPEHNRAALSEALYQRSCYATTGERIIAGLYLAGQGMGKELSTLEKPGLLINRHLTGYVACTADVIKVEIVRNGKVIQTYEPENTYSFDFSMDDMTSLDTVCFPSKNKKQPFVYYYLRVTQRGWSYGLDISYMG